jgi:hypothetical protein
LKPLVAIKRLGFESLRRLGQPTVHGAPRFSLLAARRHATRKLLRKSTQAPTLVVIQFGKRRDMMEKRKFAAS